MLLNTFNNLNYSVASSRYAVADWNRQSMPPQSIPAQPVQIQSASEPLVPTPSIQPHLAPTLSDPSQPPNKLPAPPPPPPALQNSSELLSLTETSALESFLDSIANDRSFDKLAKQWGSIDPGYGGGTKKKRKLSSSEVKIESSESPESLSAAAKRQLLTDEEKKQNHTVSEQKRRAMIRDSFRSLSDMLDSSQFEATREDKKKSRSARKAMSKYNVLNRAVVELELLRELNGKLRDLVGEIR
ncbi:DEKNAAC103558 [Brettanomyces naardenensis]|uniref:DEKNAAC103558 n=1 Tax=Brettanomyces naardenensis TaxID=13370 RepID=A0A448YNI2_BRENA|nr:DEKNAAC103558 [Brettanomyces naardenensis]